METILLSWKKKTCSYFLKIVTLLTSCNYTILDTYQETIAQNMVGVSAHGKTTGKLNAAGNGCQFVVDLPRICFGRTYGFAWLPVLPVSF